MVVPDPSKPEPSDAPPGLPPHVLAALSGRSATAPLPAVVASTVAAWRAWLVGASDDPDGLGATPRRRRATLLVAGAALATVVVLVVVSLATRPGAPVDLPMVAASPPSPLGGVPAAMSGSSTSVGPAPVVVHAAGAVVGPGVYEVPAGARVDDVVRAAGGARADADLDRVNLAAVVVDGARVYVPAEGEQMPAEAVGVVTSGATSSAGSGAVAAPAGAGAAPAAPLSLSSASLAELEDLPGVGPVTAASIDAYRSEHGGFGSVDELLEVRGIGPARMEQLRPLVVP